MDTATAELIKELLEGLKDDRQRRLVDAYLRGMTSAAMTTMALEILSEEIDAFENS